jgi:regulator of sigma E protease
MEIQEILIKTAQFLLSLSILVGLHELGHLLTAKLFGMRVETYSIGFPPKIFGRKFGETEYALGAIPLGGYVKISGMIDESLDKEQMRQPPKPWEFRSKPAWQRLIVMMGGILVNVLTGIVIFTILTFIYGESYLPASEARYGIVAHELAEQIGLKTGDKILEINGKSFKNFADITSPDLLLGQNGSYTVQRAGAVMQVKIPNDLIARLTDRKQAGTFVDPIAPFEVAKTVPGEPAAKAGLQAKDRILSVNTKKVEFFHEFQAVLLQNADKDIAMVVDRGGQAVTLNAHVKETGKLGFEPHLLLEADRQHFSLLESIPRGTETAWNVVRLNILGFAKIFRNEVPVSNAISGPIAIADMFGKTWVWQNFWELTGLLSMVLAFMNFLPIPALDGGHVMFLTYEIVARRKPSEKFLEVAQRIGLALLLSLMAYAVFNDVFRRLF